MSVIGIPYTPACVCCTPPPKASPAICAATQFLREVAETLVAKNEAYGDSAANPIRVFSRASSIEQVLVRVDDKLSRIARGAGLLAKDEDVVRDLVGYLAILAALLQADGARL